ncbi:DUF6049 family protein [Streptomyces sp. HNM0574]|uniref:DUF6049 family protein n=1 Tax=Streptomyces sp. HNM0574 TaxID=2714954 RepID=UPI00146AB2B6|nr:hypothetical protein [Streptomyces sp. HNM0574]
MAEAAEMQGTTNAPPRRWLRRTATVLTATLPLLGGLLPAATAVAQAPASSASSASPASAPASGEQGTGSRTADITVNALTPSVPEKGDTLRITGKVTNSSDHAITDGELGLRVGPKLDSRSAIEQNAKRKGYNSSADGTEVTGKRTSVDVGSMRPGISRSFSLKVPVQALKLRDSGVYQIGVALSGRTRGVGYEQVLGIERSFLPWQTSDAENKTQLTYMWPLISTPQLTARTESDEQQTPVFRDDRLAEELAPGGRLQQLVRLGKDLPITWVIDPDLLASAEAMTKRYLVRDENGKEVPGKGQEYAKQWLSDLQDAVRGEEVVALPFADPDLASLAHKGKYVPGALGNLGPATKRSEVAVEAILHTEAGTDFAWPDQGALDPSIVDVATSAGARNVIARSDHFRDTGISYTPTSARPIGGGNTALVADAGLSTAFDEDLSKPGASSKAVQRFLAQTHTLTAEQPAQQRSVVVAPQRMPTAAQARAMATSLKALNDNGSWTEGADLSAAAEAKPDPRATRAVPGNGAYPRSLRAQELPKEAYEQVRHTNAVLDDFQKILSRQDRVITPFGTALHRATSTAWRAEEQAGQDFRDDVEDYLTGLTKKVELIQKSPITLSGRSATIPVTVQNNLFQDVDGLTLKLESSRRIGLDVGKEQPVRVAGGHSQSVKFNTTAKANGRSVVKAQLYTKDGQPYGKPMTFRVNVTSITSAVLLVIAGGVLLVVLAGIRMYTQRKRRGPRPDPDAPLDETGADEDADGADEDGDKPSRNGTENGNGTGPDASGAGNDTGRESGGPPGPGEKVNR